MRLFIAFLVICCVGCSQSSRYQFSLKGNIEGVMTSWLNSRKYW